MDESRLREQLAPRYELGREIGRGGMASVYRARDLHHGRDVAIKVLHEDLSQALGPERFRREIRIAGQLSHPNILPIHDSGEAGGLLYFVMPFVDGESLRARLERERQLGLEDAVRIGCEIAAALDFAHRQGLIHRDVKPENILLPDGHAILADFGIARAIHSAREDRLTRSGITVGTPTYMSPEQAAAEPDLDGRSDIYALGCCVYEMLAGSPPFVGSTAQVVIARHTLEPAPPLHIARQTVPEHVEATVLRALAKAPADRFRTAEEFAAALSGRLSVSIPLSSRATAAVPSRSAQRRRLLIGAGVLAAAALGAVAFALSRGPQLEAAAVSELDLRRIAVLYFEDRSDGRLGYLADGLTEALIERLDAVPGLDVVSANGAEAIRGELSPEQAAREFEAGTLVRGSVEAVSGDSVRVTFELVEGVSGAGFDRGGFVAPLADPLRLRDDLADRTAEILRRRLGAEVRLQARRSDTRSGVAWGLVQQAEFVGKEAERLAAEDSTAAAAARFARADSLLAAAGRADPRWPEPAILRGRLLFERARPAEDRLEAAALIVRGLAHAESALALEARHPDALELRGSLRYLRWLLSLEPDPARAAALFRDAETDLRAAVAISPSNASAWSALSHLHYQKPDFTEAKLAAQRAYEEDAWLSAAPDIVWRLYTTSYDLEDFAGAAQWCDEGGRRYPENPRFIECRLWLLSGRGRAADVSLAWVLLDSLRHDLPPAEWEAARRELEMAVAAVIARAAGADSAPREALGDSARRVLVRARAGRDEDPLGELLGTEAFVRTLLGDRDDAFRLIKEYFAINPEHRALFARGNGWWWRPLRDDPRFAELVGYQSH